jgi:hypothetical protein
MTDRPDELDTAVQGWYAGEAPREEWLAATTRLIATTRPPVWRRSQVPALASTVAVAALLMWAVMIAPQLRTRNELARSVAALHTAAFSPEVGATDHFADLVQLPNLPFTPVEPERCRKERYKVLGARTTTIAGVSAVQIRLADDDGDVRTLCQFRGGPLASARDGRTTVDGVPVSVWHEADLVMAMTGPPP